MKKRALVATAGLLVVGLAGCGSGASPQEEYITYYEEQASGDYNSANYEMSIEDFTMDGEGSAMVSMIATQLKDMKVSGSYLLDKENKGMEFSMNIDMFGETVPVEMIWNADGMYFAGSMVSGFADIASAFGAPVDIEQTTLDELNGKYIEVTEDMLAESSGVSTDTFDFEALTGDTDNQNLFAEFIKTLDADSFKKDKDVVSHTFTFDEIKAYVAYAEKNGSEDVKKAMSEAGNLDDIEGLNKFELDTKIDTKTNKMTMVLSMDMEQDGQTVGIKMNMSVTPEKSDKIVTAPAKDAVLSEDELTEILGSTTTNAASSVTFTDAEVDELINSYESVKDSYSEEEFNSMIDEVISAYKDYLTADQLKKFEDAFK